MKLNHRHIPKRSRQTHGNYSSVRILFDQVFCVAHLGELSPVQVMPSVELENEDIVDLAFSPKFAINTKKEHQEEHKKISSI